MVLLDDVVHIRRGSATTPSAELAGLLQFGNRGVRLAPSVEVGSKITRRAFAVVSDCEKSPRRSAAVGRVVLQTGASRSGRVYRDSKEAGTVPGTAF
jgi:hypothetical protein